MLMQYKGDATCKIKNSLGEMHNIMAYYDTGTLLLEHYEEIST